MVWICLDSHPKIYLQFEDHMKKNLEISTGKSLSKAIRAIIQETIKSDLTKNAQEESDRQEKFLDEDDDLFDDKEELGDEKKKSSKTIDSEKEKLKQGDITSDDVIEKLNSIRSGKSFRDEAISKKLSEYVESLSKAERTALFAFLKGIAQLVTGEFEPESVQDPSDDPADVKMKKGAQVQKKTIKPNVINAPSPPKEEKSKKSAEDTSGPVPIKPKK